MKAFKNAEQVKVDSLVVKGEKVSAALNMKIELIVIITTPLFVI
jgi:hypothetical protein